MELNDCFYTFINKPFFYVYSDVSVAVALIEFVVILIEIRFNFK